MDNYIVGLFLCTIIETMKWGIRDNKKLRKNIVLLIAINFIYYLVVGAIFSNTYIVIGIIITSILVDIAAIYKSTKEKKQKEHSNLYL